MGKAENIVNAYTVCVYARIYNTQCSIMTSMPMPNDHVSGVCTMLGSDAKTAKSDVRKKKRARFRHDADKVSGAGFNRTRTHYYVRRQAKTAEKCKHSLEHNSRSGRFFLLYGIWWPWTVFRYILLWFTDNLASMNLRAV